MGKINIQRDEYIVSLYKEGKTEELISKQFNLTRQRIHQILKCAGITYKDGGAYKQTNLKNEQKTLTQLIKKNIRFIETYGCSLAEFIAVNNSPSQSTRVCKQYNHQRRNAKKRNIEWCISFPEWVNVWTASGKLSERGVKVGQYVMARHNDIGPYKLGNVSIKLSTENIKEYWDRVPRIPKPIVTEEERKRRRVERAKKAAAARWRLGT